ncbi:C3a anaphylatoxin chemotactic receptor [Salminus brasiliensis]|uniref:C3a anaphylatoxin chemotactic receptor n=1 Tax=Salminus brasiliensis TaxID=930266 RepID=UPI003B82E563
MNDTEIYTYFSTDPDYDYTSHDDTGTSHAITVVSLVFYCLTCLLGVPGNALVVWIAGVKMKRTVNTTWFLNLAVADLLCCLTIPFTMAAVLLSDWPFGNIMCKVLPAIIVINMFASVFTLSLISFDRFIQVIKPVWSQNNRSLGLASVCCVVAWILALLLSLPNMIYRQTLTVEDLNMTICVFVSSSGMTEEDYFNQSDLIGDSYRTLTVVRFLLGFLMPLLCIAACYTLIARKVSRSNFRSGRAFRIMLVVVLAFFLSWLPYHVLGLMHIYGEKKVSTLALTLDPLVISLAYINSCMNPVLYVFMGQDFKEKVKLSLRRVLERAFSEDGTHSSANSKGQQSHATRTSEAQL